MSSTTPATRRRSTPSLVIEIGAGASRKFDNVDRYRRRCQVWRYRREVIAVVAPEQKSDAADETYGLVMLASAA